MCEKAQDFESILAIGAALMIALDEQRIYFRFQISEPAVAFPKPHVSEQEICLRQLSKEIGIVFRSMRRNKNPKARYPKNFLTIAEFLSSLGVDIGNGSDNRTGTDDILGKHFFRTPEQ